jgi:hypothetical protein
MFRNLYNRFFASNQKASDQKTSLHHSAYVQSYEQFANHTAEKESSNYLLYLLPDNEPETLAQAQTIVEGRNAILLYPADPNIPKESLDQWSLLEYNACFIERGTWVVNQNNELLEVSVGKRASLHVGFHQLMPIIPADYVAIVVTALTAKQERMPDENEQEDPLDEALSRDIQSVIQTYFEEKELHWTGQDRKDFPYHTGFSLFENLCHVKTAEKVPEIVNLILHPHKPSPYLAAEYSRFYADARESSRKNEITKLANDYPLLPSLITDTYLNAYKTGWSSAYIKGSVLQIAALSDPTAENLLKAKLSPDQINQQLAPIYNAYATLIAQSILDGTFSHAWLSKDIELIDRHPAIASCIIDVENRKRNRIKGNLFQIALASEIPDLRTIARLMWVIPSNEALAQLDLASPPAEQARNSMISELRQFVKNRFFIEHGNDLSSEQKETLIKILKENLTDWLRKIETPVSIFSHRAPTSLSPILEVDDEDSKTPLNKASFFANQSWTDEKEANDVKRADESPRWRPSRQISYW